PSSSVPRISLRTIVTVSPNSVDPWGSKKNKSPAADVLDTGTFVISKFTEPLVVIGSGLLVIATPPTIDVTVPEPPPPPPEIVNIPVDPDIVHTAPPPSQSKREIGPRTVP